MEIPFLIIAVQVISGCPVAVTLDLMISRAVIINSKLACVNLFYTINDVNHAFCFAISTILAIFYEITHYFPADWKVIKTPSGKSQFLYQIRKPLKTVPQSTLPRGEGSKRQK